MNGFTFSIPQNIIFGKGSLKQLPEAAKKLNKSKALIISGPHLNKIGMVAACRQALEEAGIRSDAFTETEGNPSTETVDRAVERYKESGADFIVHSEAVLRWMWQRRLPFWLHMAERLPSTRAAAKYRGPLCP